MSDIIYLLDTFLLLNFHALGKDKKVNFSKTPHKMTCGSGFVAPLILDLGYR
jgi:hypothetical protein